MKSKKYLWISFVLTLLTSMLMVNVPVTASPTVTLSIDPNVTTGVAPGNDVSVNVTIDTSANITGARIWVEIDPAVLSPGYNVMGSVWLFVTAGDFLSDWADETNYNWTAGIAPVNYVEEDDGYSDISLFIKTWDALPDGHGASGTGTLVTLWFTSLNQTAYSPINITTAQYGTPPPEEALVPVEVLNEGHYNSPPAVDTGTLSIATTPVSGAVFVNGSSWGPAPQSQVVEVGNYNVSFGDVAGYTTPSDIIAEVFEDTTTDVLGTYVLIPLVTGTLNVTTTPVSGEVFVNGSSWGPAPQSQVVEVGNYIVSFGDVAGYTTPDDIIAEVFEDTTTDVLGVYVPIVVEPVYRVDLVKRSAWPEHHHYVMYPGDEDSSNDLYAIIKNVGTDATYGKVVFTIESPKGVWIAEVETDHRLLAVGEMYGAAKNYFATWTASIGNFYVTAEAYYDADGDLGTDDWTLSDDKPKTFGFKVVP